MLGLLLLTLAVLLLLELALHGLPLLLKRFRLLLRGLALLALTHALLLSLLNLAGSVLQLLLLLLDPGFGLALGRLPLLSLALLARGVDLRLLRLLLAILGVADAITSLRLR